MVVDDGVIRYDLHRHEHGAPTGTVLLLPPHIAHTGRAATARGFRKRVLYLESDVVDTALAGRVVDEPTLLDDLLHRRLDQLHRSLDEPGGALEAESRLALITDRIARRFGMPAPSGPPAAGRRAPRPARRPARRGHHAARGGLAAARRPGSPRTELRTGVRPATAPLPRRQAGGGGPAPPARRRADRRRRDGRRLPRPVAPAPALHAPARRHPAEVRRRRLTGRNADGAGSGRSPRTGPVVGLSPWRAGVAAAPRAVSGPAARGRARRARARLPSRR